MTDEAAEAGETDSEATPDDRPTVLVIDDEERVGQAFGLWLDEEYRVLTATSGQAGLELLDESVDVVLLDRHMPGLSGDEVLDRIREDPVDCRVAMVTAVDPDFDIVEMPFDHYVSKPVDQPELRSVVDRLLSLETYEERLQDLHAVSRKIAALETEKPQEKLDDSDQYATLRERHERLQAELDALIASMDRDETERLYRLIDSD